MADEELKMETKCYDANEYGYLYGLNKRIPDEEFEKVKPYFRKFKRMDFVEGNVQVTGRPEGYRCLEKDIAKVEEILGITNTLEKRQNKVKEAFADPIKKANLIDKSYEWLKMLFEKAGNLGILAVYEEAEDAGDDDEQDRGHCCGCISRVAGICIIADEGTGRCKGSCNNSSEGSNLSLNNVKSEHGGCIGYRLMYDDLIDRLIRIYTEENLYTGEKLY